LVEPEARQENGRSVATARKVVRRMRTEIKGRKGDFKKTPPYLREEAIYSMQLF
jgi:hypothetical protein